MTKNKQTKRAVVVLTSNERGVIVAFGYSDDPLDATIQHLRQARIALYWSDDMHGLPGLAAMGPSKTCRISPAVEEMVVHRVHVAMACTAAAAVAWEAMPWG